MSGARSLRVVVVGAGLAGLACASDLAAAGARVRVLEAGDAVGGRMRTDRQAGFLLDRGFQVFNTSYPQVQRRVRLRALRLRPFTPGLLLHTGRGRVRFTDPTRRPRQMADVLRGRLAGPRDMAALARLSARDMLAPARLIRSEPDHTTRAALAGAGISAELVERLFRPFLAGVFLEDDLDTSSRFFHLVWRSMLRGSLCLPRRGMQAVPEQLAQALPPSTVRLETPVARPDRRRGAAHRRPRGAGRHRGRGDRARRGGDAAPRPGRARHPDRHHALPRRARPRRWPSRPCWSTPPARSCTPAC